MEMIEDIVAEMYKDMPRVVDTKVILRNYADRIEAAVKREREAVGNAAKMRETLDEIRVAAMSDYEWDADYLIEKCNAALSAPPRNCDVMSLKSARALWFAKEIIPRLNGDLPLGKEIPFDEWFVSQLKQETEGESEAK